MCMCMNIAIKKADKYYVKNHVFFCLFVFYLLLGFVLFCLIVGLFFCCCFFLGGYKKKFGGLGCCCFLLLLWSHDIRYSWYVKNKSLYF